MTEPTAHHATAHRPGRLAGSLAVAAVLCVLVLAAPAASAHVDTATIEAVTDATLTVAGDNTAGAKLDPVPMQPASTTTTTGPGATGVPELKSTPEQTAPDDDPGTSPIWWVLGGVVVVVALGLGAVFVLRGRDQGPIE